LSFIGSELQLEIFSPSFDTPIIAPVSAVVGDGVEFSDPYPEQSPQLVEGSIDISATSIVYQIDPSTSFSSFTSGSFNGYVLTDLLDTLPAIADVSINAAGTTLGVEASDITFTEDQIRANVEGLPFAPGDTLTLDVSFLELDDPYETNNTLETAYDLSSSEGISLSAIAGLATQSDDDWFRINVLPGRNTVTVDLQFDDSAGDIDLGLYNASGQLIDTSDSATDNELLSALIPTAGTYYLQVYGFGGETDNTYDLEWNSSFVDDAYEENDTLETAYDLTGDQGVLLSDIAGLGVQGDDDWYRFDLAAANTIVAELQFDDTYSDIDLELYDANAGLIASSSSVTDNEVIQETLSAGSYYARVINFEGNPNVYDLVWDVV